MYTVYQHWDPLKVCIVGRSYPPEFYSWIKVPHVRAIFERMAAETEEDYQNLIAKLESFGVKVLRPNLPEEPFAYGQYIPPPMVPRDFHAMIGDTFYTNFETEDGFDFKNFYNNVRADGWPNCESYAEFCKLPQHIQDECRNDHNLEKLREKDELNNNIDKIRAHCYADIYKHIEEQGNKIKYNFDPCVNGAMVARIGKDLYFGTHYYDEDPVAIKARLDQEFTQTRNHIINTGGHADGTYCPVTPGLIISLHDVPTYAETYPGWEVVYLPGQSWDAIPEFKKAKEKNRGKWWIPGFEEDQAVVDTVETWMDHWTGYVEETVFDVNMLIIDPKNVLVFSYNKQVFDALEKYGITPHIVPFRHRYFWDGGLHCITGDLHREGVKQDFFPDNK